MLTKERNIVIDAMRTYPPGQPENAWGWGPMEIPEDDSVVDPEDFDREVLITYG